MRCKLRCIHVHGALPQPSVLYGILIVNSIALCIPVAERPEAAVDNRTLYERLKEQKDQKQEEFTEKFKFSEFHNVHFAMGVKKAYVENIMWGVASRFLCTWYIAKHDPILDEQVLNR